MSRTNLRPLRAVLAALALVLTGHACAQATAPAAAPAFDILEFDVDGNTVLPDAAIERTVTPFLGEGKGMDDVEAARAALEKAYQGAGYLTVFVDVPEQRIADGVVHMTVLEGRVERLKVSGSHYFSQGWIRTKVPELADGKVPNFNEVQRQLALVNRTEDRRVQPIMRAGVAPGTVETELKVDDKLPLHGSLELNDRNAAETKPLRLAVNARYDNLWQRDHSLSLTLLTAPQATSESRVATVNYSVPGDDGATWLGYAIYSNSAVAAIGNVTVLGKGTIVGLRYATSLPTPADQVQSVSFGVDFKDVRQRTVSGASAISTPLRYLPLQFAWNGTFDLADRQQLQASLQMTGAFRELLARTVDCPGGAADQFACSRQDGDGSFGVVRVDLRHALSLGANGGSLNLRLNAQASTGPLPSGEQFTAGGAESVRGYYEAEAAGDRGALASLEWHSPAFGDDLSRWLARDGSAPKSPWLTQTYALAFIEGARTTIFEPATGQAAAQSLAGTGIGLRARLRNNTSGELDLAWPLKSTQTTDARSLRAHFRFATEF